MDNNDKSILATHIPLLIRIFDKSEGDVLEIGTGWFSTIVLDWLANIYKRNVYSYESSGYWYERAKRYESKFHHIIKIENWEELPADKHWGLVFVDHSPEARRHIEIERFKDLADYIVVHDTQPEDDAKYQYSGSWKHFKYKYDWTKVKPWTSVVSNLVDLDFLRNDLQKINTINFIPSGEAEKTVLYYTADTEDESLAAVVRKNIARNKGNLPLVSVSQKPIANFGTNICVGSHDNCYANEFRQIQEGLKKVETKWVITAEADTLYPPDYFKFEPREEGYIYRYDNVWVAYNDNPNYIYKSFSESSQIIETKVWAEELNRIFEGQREWFLKHEHVNLPPQKASDLNHTWTGMPVVTFKTGKGVSKSTVVKKGVIPQASLPYWGPLDRLRKDIKIK